MEKLRVGSVVLVSFPFSNLKGNKVRPACILACCEFGNYILCQITSKPYSSKTTIPIELSDFSKGALPIKSYARPDKIFTATPEIVKRKVGDLRKDKRTMVLKRVRNLFVA